MDCIIDGTEYRISHNLAEQINKTVTVKYDSDYISKAYDKVNPLIDSIRFNLVERFRPTSILDFGCGNASFLKYCRSKNEFDLYGHDIVNYNNPFFTNDYTYKVDTVCFFDSLEHLENPNEILSQLNCDNILISLPWCKFPLTIDWFKGWKHRKPGEHFWFFNQDSLESLLKPYGFKLQFYGNYEDVVRVDKDNNPNILTCGFSR